MQWTLSLRLNAHVVVLLPVLLEMQQEELGHLVQGIYYVSDGSIAGREAWRTYINAVSLEHIRDLE